MKKLDVINVNVYKPELTYCPICEVKLVYKYATNNKKVQFRNGESFTIKNLAYACNNINCTGYKHKYTSQNVNRLCLKGCTYSIKTIWSMIYFYHYLDYTIEKISSILMDDSIQICDKNILLLIKKNYSLLELDYTKNINVNYEEMYKNYSCIMIFLNVVNIEEKCLYINIKNAFTDENIGAHFIESLDYDKVQETLTPYFNTNHTITHLFIDKDNKELIKCLNPILNEETILFNFVKYKAVKTNS